jgi:hypothetical protein
MSIPRNLGNFADNVNVNGKVEVTGINATGTPSGSTVLYGNGTWATAGGGSSQWTTSGSNIYYSTGKVSMGTATADNGLRVNYGDFGEFGNPVRETIRCTFPNDSSGALIILGNAPTGSQTGVQLFSYQGNLTFNNAVSSAGGAYIWQTYGTERMRIDSVGRTTTPYQPSFRAGRGSTQTVTSNSTIIFDTVSGSAKHNVGNCYSTSTGIFTAPVTGVYYFHAQVIIQSATNNGDYADLLGLILNGGIVAYSEKRCNYVVNYTGNGGYFVDNISGILKLSAGDSVVCRNMAQVTIDVHGNANYAIFEGYLLG